MKYLNRCPLWAASALLLVACLGLFSQIVAAEHAAVEARILKDITFLASEKCEGRGINTEGINVAADYIADEFKELGLKPPVENGTYFQPFDITGGSKIAQGNQLAFRGPIGQTISLKLGQHFTVVAFGAAKKVTAPVVFAGYGITSDEPKYDDFDGLDVEGKIVIMIRKAPLQNNNHLDARSELNSSRNTSLQAKASNAETRGAVGVIFVNDNSYAAERDDRLMPFSYTAQSRNTLDVPMIHLRRSIVNQMLRTSSITGLTSLEKAIDRNLAPAKATLVGWTCELETSLVREKTPVKNVVGVLEGSGPLADETIVIGAHYDHLGRGGMGSLQPGARTIHYGADDNASGTASLIELARRYAEQPNRQGRRLVFIAFSGEETGLLGSIHYCKEPYFPLESTVTMVNMDMVGRLRENELTIYGTGTAEIFDPLIDDLNAKHKFEVKKVRTGTGPSDHSTFYSKQIPVFHFFTGLHGQYHRPSDTIDTVNVSGVRRITDMIDGVVSHLARVEKRPEYIRIAGGNRPGSGGPRGPRLGIRPDYSDDNPGVLLDGVSEGTPAEKAGILGGDRIIEIAGKPVKNLTGYMTVMGRFKKGDKFEVVVDRDGKKKKLSVTLE